MGVADVDSEKRNVRITSSKARTVTDYRVRQTVQPSFMISQTFPKYLAQLLSPATK